MAMGRYRISRAAGNNHAFAFMEPAEPLQQGLASLEGGPLWYLMQSVSNFGTPEMFIIGLLTLLGFLKARVG